MAEGKRWRVSWTRVVVGIVIAWAGLLFLGMLAVHVMAWYTAKETGDDPRLVLQPQPLVDVGIADLKDGMTIRRFGYSLQVPWEKVIVDRDMKIMEAMSFSDGSSLLMFDPHERVDYLSPEVADARGMDAMKQLFGDEAVHSHYALAKAAIDENPNEVSIFHSRRANTRATTLLMMKTLEVPEQATAAYSISSSRMRGFQFGDPQKVPTFVEVLMFDDQDRGLKLIFKGPKGGTQPVLTQAEVNAIVASIHRTD